MESAQKALRSRSRAVIAGLVAVALLLLAPPAWSDADGNPPQAAVSVPEGLTSAERELFRGIFGGAGEWAPVGVPVADSGFRPYPNGFSFLNFGPNLYFNQRFLGQPEPLARNGVPVSPFHITSRDMRLIFGDGVCIVDGALAPNGPCALTESALAILELSKQWTSPGRCYGFVTVAAGFFNGIIPPAVLRTGEVNSMTTLNRPTQRALARTVISQYFSAKGFRQDSMAQLISTLRESLSSGQTQYSILLFGQPGGHGVLPYAVLDRGNGRFDIAIYDPNFPNQARSVRVDVNANSWEYEGSALPGTGSLAWSSAGGPSSSIWFGDVASGLAKQDCPFCLRSAEDTVVSFSSLLSENAGVFEAVRILHPDGRPLDPDLFEILPIINQVGEDLVNPPAIRVKTGVDFIVSIDSAGVVRPQPLIMTVVRPGEVRRVDLEDLAPQVRTQIRIAAQLPVAQVISEPVRRVQITQTLESNPSSFRFSSQVVPRRGSVNVTLRVDPDKKRLFLRNGSQNVQNVTLRLRSRTEAGFANYGVRGIMLPPGARLVGNFSQWEGPMGRPSIWLQSGPDSSRPNVRVPVKRLSGN